MSKRKQLLRQMDEDYRAVLDSPAGRRFFYQLLVDAGVWRYLGEEGLAYAVGQRNFGCALMVRAQSVAPAMFAQMIHEATDAEREEAALRLAAEENTDE